MPSLLLRFLAVVVLAGAFACGEGEVYLFDSAQAPLNVQALTPQSVYEKTVHAIVTTSTCGGCHKVGGLGAGAYADANIETAFEAAVKMPLFNPDKVSESKILKKLAQSHNCGTREQCDEMINKVTLAIGKFAQQAPKSPFTSIRIESSGVAIQTLLQNPTVDTVRFDLPTLNTVECTPTVLLKWTSTQTGLFSVREPSMRINCSKNIRLKNVQVLLNGLRVPTTFGDVDTWHKGPIDSDMIMENVNHASATFQATANDVLSLGFEVLEYAR